ncbi:16S rRNA (guanine966-N2)-methyltransferase [Georgenia satyanarayanai]|uniref:16S rRNA (Guanine966-N2)-methyltransferase n=1 Tax=Georgenia satyanarayanai TaxID=860221 RepID=A0A2Y9A1I9_9MICO|nr:16S rRNA (guanine(966)-N(2))-methyltransferase RsmD [Georgenia satyanarayanai]PYG01549.1 16S rRNA (guanine966-N2)-methyltransferase [Georgenia satyanarayanai]SSA36349.1 16S rRNA (guanine966-N2)-methyltransferase [Georgenia satyanarayanai]
MTRIVSGAAGGRTLTVPKGPTRPTSERVREALFSRLEHQGVVDGARVLDLYAGSGALGLEAASRGAVSVTLVDSAKPAAAACRRNVAVLGLQDSVVVVGGTARGHLMGAPSTAYDLVLVDPPYDVTETDLGDVLAALTAWLAPDAVVVVERSRRSPEPTWPPELERTDERRYGDTTLWFASTVPGEEAVTVTDMGERAGEQR